MTFEISAISDAVKRVGWCRLGPMSGADYRALIRQLGAPWFETAVELRPDVRSYLCKPEPVPFHTDHPNADWISWQCEVQDDRAGAQQFVDGLDALQACGPGIREALRNVHAEVRVRRDSPPSTVPIVRHSSDGDRLFYASWIKPTEQDPDTVSAFDTLKAEIERRSVTHVQEVRLSACEVLIADNGRLLHGRQGLESTSKRCLRRFWIRQNLLHSIDHIHL